MLQTTRDLRSASVNGLAKGAKGRGRPTRTWLRHSAEWTGIGITTCVREAESRQKFHNGRQSLLYGNYYDFGELPGYTTGAQSYSIFVIHS